MPGRTPPAVRIALGAALVGILLVQLFGARPNRGGPWPVRWTESLGLADLTEIEAALDRPVDMSRANGTLILTRSDPDDGSVERVDVRTPREYLRYTAEGFYARTTYDLSMAAWFIAVAEPLDLLRHVRPSRTSWLAGLSMGNLEPDDLPGELAPALWRPAADVVPSWTAALPGSRVTARSGRSITIEGVGLRSTLDAVARGDFDGDGVEDLLLHQADHATGGTYRHYRHVLLTRRGAGEPLEVIEAARGSAVSGAEADARAERSSVSARVPGSPAPDRPPGRRDSAAAGR